MMANGTSGDVNNISFRAPRPPTPPYVQMRKVAEDVAGKVNAALAGVQWTDHAPLDARFRELDLAWRPIDAELMSWAKEKQGRPPIRATSKTDMLKDLCGSRAGASQRQRILARYPVQVLRIGDVCIGTSPCETLLRRDRPRI